VNDTIRALVVIPTYNESEDIERLCRTLCENPRVSRVLVVDDASPDGTAEIVKRITHDLPVSVLERKEKDGRGGAVLDGIAEGLKDGGLTHFVEMDADFSHAPLELDRLLDVADEHDVVIGSRYIRGSKISNWPIRRRVFSSLANRFARAMLRVGVRDYTNGYRCYSRRAMEALDRSRVEPKGFIALSAILVELHGRGCSITEVPTHFVNRVRGVSSFSRREISEAFWNVLRLRRARRERR
jgi:glycosyltransferase involved in cell wall biosynthesis